jgi:hypothetical protein
VFRQAIDRLGLSIEEGTARVPDDGRFYVIEHGVALKSFVRLKQATAMYEQLKADRRQAATTPEAPQAPPE